ncbi:uncharacterized protein UTRI_02983 [Ustilago trichophora]|uniref:Uncharacterized protein n=1 Tax=Ustilago trichophora TaxID=86804 RepID=A0A5C3ERI7_9BASI|nr:uncharacterized protein UTRI_02983 [Ustilago trichophora]
MKFIAAFATLLMLAYVQACIGARMEDSGKLNPGYSALICHTGYSSVNVADAFITNFSVERFAFGGTYECHGADVMCFNMKGDNRVHFYHNGFLHVAFSTPDQKCTKDNNSITCHP